jgi:hypothetical protein
MLSSLEMTRMAHARRLAGRWITEHTAAAIVLAGLPSVVAAAVAVLARLLDVRLDRVFLLIGALTCTSGLMVILVLFIRHVVNYARLTTAAELD